MRASLVLLVFFVFFFFLQNYMDSLFLVLHIKFTQLLARWMSSIRWLNISTSAKIFSCFNHFVRPWLANYSSLKERQWNALSRCMPTFSNLAKFEGIRYIFCCHWKRYFMLLKLLFSWLWKLLQTFHEWGSHWKTLEPRK